MWTLTAIGVLVAAIVGGIKYGMTPDTMLIAASIFSIAAAIEIAAVNINKKK